MNSQAAIRAHAERIFRQNLHQVQVDTGRVFFWLLLVQWAAAILLAIIVSPYAWAGSVRTVHLHVQLALFGGAVLNALPLTLMRFRPGAASTQHVVAITQMLWSAMFVHLTGGRIETHFHIFGSLAFLSFYRDPRLLITATLVVALDHLLLGFFWPESVYGIANPEWWRFMEHAAWVIFEDVVLWLACVRALNEMKILAQREASLESAMHGVEDEVAERTEELKSSADRYKTLMENTSAIPWEIDRTSCAIIYIAPQGTAIFGAAEGVSEESVDFAESFHPGDREEFRRFIANAARGSATGETYIDTRIVRDDTVRYMRSFIAQRADDAEAATVCGISLDITQQKNLEHELSQAHKLESIGQLSAGIAHEINTPTQFIGDNIRFLQESVGEVFGVLEALTPHLQNSAQSAQALQEMATLLSDADLSYLRTEVPKAISQSLDGVERITKIVGAMKEFSHPAIDRTPHDLNRAIASTITVASNEWKYVADVHTEFDASLPQVTVMPGAFNQVILNILVNAAHAVADANTANPAVKGKIIVSTRRIDQWAEIRITDSGCGIPEKIRDRIFDPFFTTKPVGKGTGQGLAIAHDVIVKKHKGAIAMESEPGQGTTFIIRIPIDGPADAAVAA